MRAFAGSRAGGDSGTGARDVFGTSRPAAAWGGFVLRRVLHHLLGPGRPALRD
jgi:hypothetical protein